MVKLKVDFWQLILFSIILLAITCSLPPNATADRGIGFSINEHTKIKDKKVAFIIGNTEYMFISALKNPENDANEVAKKLESLGFEVLLSRNDSSHDFDEKLRKFEKITQNASVAMLYYAGHGIQYENKNYIIPVDAKLNSKYQIQRATFPIDLIVETMNKNAGMSLIFLDACRNNPLPIEIRQRMSSTRSLTLSDGLAPISTGHDANTLIMFAARPGSVAADGKGKHSPFTKAFLKYVDMPDTQIEIMLKKVVNEVYLKTRKKQRPETLSDLTSTFYFNPKDQTQYKSSAPLKNGDIAALVQDGDEDEVPDVTHNDLTKKQYCDTQFYKARRSSDPVYTLQNEYIARCRGHRYNNQALRIIEEVSEAKNCERCKSEQSISACRHYIVSHPGGFCYRTAQNILDRKLGNPAVAPATAGGFAGFDQDQLRRRKNAEEREKQRQKALDRRQWEIEERERQLAQDAQNRNAEETRRRQQEQAYLDQLKKREEIFIARLNKLENLKRQRPVYKPRPEYKPVPAPRQHNGCLGKSAVTSQLRNHTIFGKTASGKIWRAYFPAGKRAEYQFSNGTIKDASWRVSSSGVVYISFDDKKYFGKQICLRNGKTYWQNSDDGNASSILVARQFGYQISQGGYDNNVPSTPRRTHRSGNRCLTGNALRRYIRGKTLVGQTRSGKVWRAYFPKGKKAFYRFSDNTTKRARWYLRGNHISISFDGKNFFNKKVCIYNGSTLWTNLEDNDSSSRILQSLSGNRT